MKNGFKILQLLKQLEREQYALVEMVQCGATGSHVTGSMFWACATNPALFSYYSSSTKSSTSSMATGSDRKSRDPFGFPWSCACAIGSRAISAIVGSFHWKCPLGVLQDVRVPQVAWLPELALSLVICPFPRHFISAFING